MSYLVDTNVFAAVMAEQRSVTVETWLAENQTELYTSSLTIGEISFGVERLPPGRKRSRLQAGLDGLIESMGDRILRFDTRVGLVWGRLRADLIRAGAQIQLEDSYIAAVASSRINRGHPEHPRFPTCWDQNLQPVPGVGVAGFKVYSHNVCYI